MFTYKLTYGNSCLPFHTGYIPKNLRFLARSMKTMGEFGRYPRKISLLKDLRKGYPGAFLLSKSMKTCDEFGVPSKISLLKDLAEETFRGAGTLTCRKTRLPRNPNCQRAERLTAVIQTANVVVDYVSRLVSPASSEKWSVAGSRKRETLGALSLLPPPSPELYFPVPVSPAESRYGAGSEFPSWSTHSPSRCLTRFSDANGTWKFGDWFDAAALCQR
jgi:hypothetical protein